VLVFCCTFINIENNIAQDSIFSLSSVPENHNNFWRRVSVGGNLGFQVGSVTGITVSPDIGIRIVDQLYLGLRLTYQYYSYKNYYYDYTSGDYISFQSNVFGGGIYARYVLSSLFDGFLGNLFTHAEYEYLAYLSPYAQTSQKTNIVDPYGFYYVKGQETVEFNSIFLGGGYRQPIGNKVSMDIMILFNINDTYNSPYSNPIFRIGVGVGL
jgi:hypothetical protein